MKKRAFTLIEVVVSLTLLSLLLGTLFFYYRSLSTQKKGMSDHLWALKEETFCEMRLRPLFSSCNSLFTAENSHLVFTCERKAEQDPLLSGKVLARLFWDQGSETLCITFWPDPKTKLKTPSETLLLIDHVQKPTFE